MAGKRKNGEGTWGSKNIKGTIYQYFRDPEGKYTYGKTTKEVRDKLKAKKESLPQSSTPKETFGDFLMRWLNDEKAIGVKRNTLNGYIDCMNGQLIHNDKTKLATVQLGVIKTKHFQEYYKVLATQYTKGTISKNYAIISQCILYGNKRGSFSEKIDLDEIKIPHEDVITKETREIHFLDDEDIKKLMQEADRINEPGFNFGGKLGEPVYGNAAQIVVFILNTGLRISEAIDLRKNDIDLENKIAYVNSTNSVIKENGKRINVSTSTKTNAGKRMVPLNKAAIKIIEKQLNADKKTDNDYLFVTQKGTPFSRRNIATTLDRMVVRANLKYDHITPHELRHTLGSTLLRHGVDIKTVSEILGHSDISVTYKIYIHVLQEQKMKAVDLLDKINFGNEKEGV